MNLADMLKEIRFFGVKPTLDSIEQVKSPRLRLKLRRLFEEAFHILRVGDYRYQNITWPDTTRPKGENQNGQD
jgi:hypothetical protein